MDEFVFPHKALYLGNTTEKLSEAGPGMTKREWFAGMAMQGLLVNDARVGFCACAAVVAADRLLEELNKRD